MTAPEPPSEPDDLFAEIDSGRVPSSPRAASGSVPERIGPYEIEGVLGEGGMGTVYLGMQHDPTRRVAVKVVRVGYGRPDVVRRFEAEQQAIARLNHAYIAKVYRAGVTEESVPYFAMEYVDGKPLLDYCDAERLTIRERLELFRKVCDGVQHAHQKAIIHRDLKPSNIMVAEEDGNAVPKIIDFGLAKSLEDPLTEHTQLTGGPGSTLGTPHYMSPEQATGAKSIDTRTDVYALGAVLYGMLTGRSLFDFETIRDRAVERVFDLITNQDPVPPSDRLGRDEEAAREHASRARTSSASLARALRGDLDRIVLMCVRKEPERRYASAAELSEDVLAYLENRPVEASRPSAAYRTRKFLRRNRFFVTVAATLVLGLAVAFAVVNDARLEAVAAASVTEQASRRAARNLDLANERLAEFERMADVKRIQERIAEANSDLWPARPDKVAAMEAWLRESEEMADRLEGHRATLDAMRRGGVRDVDAATDAETWIFEDPRDQWMHDTLAALVADLERFCRPATPNERGGLLADLRARLAVARAIERETIDEPRELWDEAIASIADRDECPMYGGLVLTPQLGLVPMGRDPESGLWEFGVWQQTGEVPQRGPDGRLAFDESSGIVLVLVPEGSFEMGAVGVNGAFPVHTVALDAFFISKYEMTQAQWEAFTGENPAYYAPSTGEYRSNWDRLPESEKQLRRHPIENLTWAEYAEVLRRLDLGLPTEAQWEYAARAGTSTTWWSGDDPASVAGAANLHDRFAATVFPAEWGAPEAFDDGFVVHGPVGRFRANPWGLHDVMGNVLEFCRDGFANYDRPVREGDGERRSEGPIFSYSIRGGCYLSGLDAVRSVHRNASSPTQRSDQLGVRPMREIVSAAPEEGP